MSLSEKLRSVYKGFVESAPKEVLETFEKASQHLAEKKLEKSALKVGQKMPNFELKNAFGKVKRSSELLSKGPLVISFYRGSW